MKKNKKSMIVSIAVLTLLGASAPLSVRADDNEVLDTIIEQESVLGPLILEDWSSQKSEITKKTICPLTGESADDDGRPYLERVQRSFYGWSFHELPVDQYSDTTYNGTITDTASFWDKAFAMGAVTFGSPREDYRGVVPDTPPSMPYLNMHAVWDEYPQILVSDYYYTLAEAQGTTEHTGITLEELFSQMQASDAEDANILKVAEEDFPDVPVEDTTYVTIVGYSPEEFAQFTGAGSASITFKAMDSFRNITTKTVTVHIIDTVARVVPDAGNVRMISEKYYRRSETEGGLPEDSVWLKDSSYVDVIERAFNNENNHTPIKSYHFSAEDIKKAKQYIKNNGMGNSKSHDALANFTDVFNLD